MQTPSLDTADADRLPLNPPRRRFKAWTWVVLGLVTLFVLGGIGTVGAVALLEDADGSLEGY